VTFPVSRPDAHLSTVPSGRRFYCPDLQDRSASFVRTKCSSRPDPILYREVFCASLHQSGRFSSTFGCLSVLDQFLISFQVPRKGRSINRPDDVVSHPDARLLKAGIVIQIWPSSSLTAMVRTRVHQRRKLLIRLQSSGRLSIMVWTRALQIWKLRVEE
jgi:hypothetical protein